MGNARTREYLEYSPQGSLVLSPTKTFQTFRSLDRTQRTIGDPSFSVISQNGISCLQEITGPTCGVQSKYGGFLGHYIETLVLVFSGAFKIEIASFPWWVVEL